MSVTVIKQREVNYVPTEGINGELFALSRDIHPISETMGGGFARIVRATMEWQVRYDEVIYVVSGNMYLLDENGDRRDAEQGDLFYISKGTPIVYGTDEEAVFFYAIYPGNWKELEAQAQA